MAGNFFDLVSGNFFNPFTTKNKRYNYDLLQLINSRMSLDNLQAEKETIVDWIVDYIDNCPIDLFDDETDDLEADVRSFAYNKVRYFNKCGWLVEDIEGISIKYQMDENGIKMLAAMENAIKDDTKSLEFSGYVYNIYSNLQSFQFDMATAVVEQIYESSMQLNSMLRGLNVSIKKFLAKLIKENEAMPKEILQTIFFDYQKKVVLKAFHNFRTNDNPAKYRYKIEDKINNLLQEDNLDKMANNYLLTKHDGDIQFYSEACTFFEERLNHIRDQFEEMEGYLKILDKRNTTYVITAQSRLNFLLNEETNIEGRIIDCLKKIPYAEDDFFDDSAFDIFSGENIDEQSLYEPITKRSKPKPEPIVQTRLEDPETIAELAKQLFKDNVYSVGEINKYIMSQIGTRDSIISSEIKTIGFDDVIKLFLAQVYSSNNGIDYEIIFTDEYTKIEGYKFKDFKIKRRTK